jgi:hypothetical protein
MHQFPPFVTFAQSAANWVQVRGADAMPAARRILGLYHITVTDVSLNGMEYMWPLYRPFCHCGGKKSWTALVERPFEPWM